MKKAKFMLAAIAVLAIAGGVYASKANRGLSAFCTTTATGTPVEILDRTATTGVANIYCLLPTTTTLVYTRTTIAD
jgi:hypothetical protein